MFDVRNEQNIIECVQWTVTTFGSVDVLINNAGVYDIVGLIGDLRIIFTKTRYLWLNLTLVSRVGRYSVNFHLEFPLRAVLSELYSLWFLFILFWTLYLTDKIFFSKLVKIKYLWTCMVIWPCLWIPSWMTARDNLTWTLNRWIWIFTRLENKTIYRIFKPQDFYR